jgi:isoamyl acetate esterase
MYFVSEALAACDNHVDATMLCSDGLHFTPVGNKILFEEVVKTLETSIGFSQERLPSDLPLFHEIDPKDPMKAFGA